MGTPFLRRRKSSLIDGVGDDARELSEHLADWLARRAASRDASRDVSVRRIGGAAHAAAQLSDAEPNVPHTALSAGRTG
jgi:hypothetical protein